MNATPEVWTPPPRSYRRRRTIDGILHVQCSSCRAFYPATRDPFFFQGKGGCRGPHSWCKPCYASNNGRGKGMRCVKKAAAPVPPVCHSARDFVRLPVPASLVPEWQPLGYLIAVTP